MTNGMVKMTNILLQCGKNSSTLAAFPGHHGMGQIHTQTHTWAELLQVFL